MTHPVLFNLPFGQIILRLEDIRSVRFIKDHTIVAYLDEHNMTRHVVVLHTVEEVYKLILT